MVQARFVPIKTVEEQAALTMLGARDLLVKQRTMLVNTIRGHAAEFGIAVLRIFELGGPTFRSVGCPVHI